MKTTELLKTLISEALYKSAFEELYKTYVEPKKISFDNLKRVILIDPFTRYRGEKEDVLKMKPKDFEENVKIGKYSKWLVKTYVDGLMNQVKELLPPTASSQDVQSEYVEKQRLFLEDDLRIRNLLEKYDKYKSFIKNEKMKNIVNVPSIEELANLEVLASDEGDVVELQSYTGRKKVKQTSTGQERQVVSPDKRFVFPGSQILKVGKNFTLIKIEGQGQLSGRAASYFGGYHKDDKGETNWCTSPEGSTACQNYLSESPLYIFMANDDKGKVGEITGLPVERYQFHFGKYTQFKNRLNGDINPVEFLNGVAADLKDLIKNEFARDLSVGGKKLEINSFGRGGVGTFVALYGLEELFESLPEEIQQIEIEQSSSQPVMIRIPDSISRFQNLNSLILTNSISELNPAICKCQNISWIGLENNTNLQSIPECIWNLPKIVILNFQGSNNVKVDKSKISEDWLELDQNVFIHSKRTEM